MKTLHDFVIFVFLSFVTDWIGWFVLWWLSFESVWIGWSCCVCMCCDCEMLVLWGDFGLILILINFFFSYSYLIWTLMKTVHLFCFPICIWFVPNWMWFVVWVLNRFWFEKVKMHLKVRVVVMCVYVMWLWIVSALLVCVMVRLVWNSCWLFFFLVIYFLHLIWTFAENRSLLVFELRFVLDWIWFVLVSCSRVLRGFWIGYDSRWLRRCFVKVGVVVLCDCVCADRIVNCWFVSLCEEIKWERVCRPIDEGVW